MVEPKYICRDTGLVNNFTVYVSWLYNVIKILKATYKNKTKGENEQVPGFIIKRDEFY